MLVEPTVVDTWRIVVLDCFVCCDTFRACKMAFVIDDCRVRTRDSDRDRIDDCMRDVTRFEESLSPKDAVAADIVDDRQWFTFQSSMNRCSLKAQG